MAKKVKIFISGVSHGNPGPSGYCAVVVKDVSREVLFGSSAKATSNHIELKALEESLLSVQEFPETVIYTNNKYIFDAFCGRAKRHKEDYDLWKTIDLFRRCQSIRCELDYNNSEEQFCARIAKREAAAFGKVKIFIAGYSVSKNGIVLGGYSASIHGAALPTESTLFGTRKKEAFERSELRALVTSLESLIDDSSVFVYTTSLYIVRGINLKDRRSGNKDLWQKLDEVSKRHRITCVWSEKEKAYPEIKKNFSIAKKTVEEKIDEIARS